MIPRRLSSLQHPLVKKLVKLRENRAFRTQEKSVLIVGETVIRDVAKHMPIKTLISVEPLSLSANETFLATPEVLKKIIALQTEDLVAAEVVLPEPSSLQQTKKLIVLDGLSDPGNVGTILRTALGLGFDGAFLTPKTADPFNDKALRASRGAPLFLPLKAGTWEELTALIQSRKMHLYVADVHGKPLSSVSFHSPLALVMGHETEGPSPIAKKLGEAISIPMTDQMESLNVASAAAIFIYTIRNNHE